MRHHNTRTSRSQCQKSPLLSLPYPERTLATCWQPGQATATLQPTTADGHTVMLCSPAHAVGIRPLNISFSAGRAGRPSAYKPPIHAWDLKKRLTGSSVLWKGQTMLAHLVGPTNIGRHVTSIRRSSWSLPDEVDEQREGSEYKGTRLRRGDIKGLFAQAASLALFLSFLILVFS